ncbi:hypothetical protein GW17_00062270 [Ensete ventricosum]|nr:hypothetical protein GW17_00062270 [Ensete ventricosum]
MFITILKYLHRVSKERVTAKVDLLRSFGWSESEFFSAVKQSPRFLCLSLELLRKKMEFLINEVGYVPSFIADHSYLLKYSLEKRVIPRFRVLDMLNTKGLWTRRGKFPHFLQLSDKKFMEKIVLPYKEKVPELLDISRVAGSRASDSAPFPLTTSCFTSTTCLGY